MSHYTNVKINLVDKECLIEALLEMGWTLDQLTLCAQPSPLYGWQGDQRKDLADIIIRRDHVGRASNDLGFRREKDGTYTAIISEFDTANGYGLPWVNKLKQIYGVKVVEKQARRKGMTVKKTRKEDGTIQLVLLKGK